MNIKENIIKNKKNMFKASLILCIIFACITVMLHLSVANNYESMMFFSDKEEKDKNMMERVNTSYYRGEIPTATKSQVDDYNQDQQQRINETVENYRFHRDKYESNKSKRTFGLVLTLFLGFLAFNTYINIQKTQN